MKGRGKLPIHVSVDAVIMDWLVAHSDGKSISSMVNDILKAHVALPRYQHVKRGTIYSILGRFEVQASEPIVEGKWVVAYQCDNGSKWARPESEFFDGRFVKL